MNAKTPALTATSMKRDGCSSATAAPVVDDADGEATPDVEALELAGSEVSILTMTVELFLHSFAGRSVAFLVNVMSAH